MMASRTATGMLLQALLGGLIAWGAHAQTTAPASPAAAAPVAEEDAPLPANLPPAIAQALKAARLPASAVSFYVQEVGAARPLLSVNADKAFNPASTMKLVTTYAALELLGPAYTWKTQALTTGSIANGVLNGDLIFKGGGDPKLTHEHFWLMLRKLRNKGIREIKGNVVFDRSYFDTTSYDPSKFDGEPQRAYNAGPDALLINFKALALQLHGNEAANTVTVVSEPKLANYPVTGSVNAAKGGACAPRQRVAATLSASGATVSGAFPTTCGEAVLYVHPHVLTHVQYNTGLFKQLWSDLGGNHAGEVRDGRVPAGATLLVEHESESLAEAVRGINKFSNNVMARQLYLTLSADILKLPGSPERSFRAVQSWLTIRGLAMPELVIENGSGLSRIERISAGNMGRMLVAAYKSPVMPEFISSMPLVAYDGTMRRRLKAQDVAGQAHIKTGTLNDTRTIAGYVLAVSGKRYAVVSLINHPAAPASQVTHDVFLNWVYANG